MTQTRTEPESADATSARRAVIYLRVSSSGQVGRENDVEGYSIPAQREACRRKAQSLGAVVDREHEFVDYAESARSADRPRLKAMLDTIKAERFDYLIIYDLSRLARNRLDDALLMVEIQAAGTKLVSVAENVDETPAGMLTHGVLAAVNEFRSRGDAEKVKLGLRRKHQAGGTPYEAPIGYRNDRAIENGHEIRTVVIDEERAPLVRHAFDAYATGEWALTVLADHLEDLGLQTRQRGSRPSAPLARSAVHHMLQNPHYIGLVPYRGVMRPGNHPPLVDRKVFDRVQQLLAAHALSGDRSSKHENYLKGSIFCGACGARLTYGRHRARSGQHYEYFSCARKRTSGRVHCTSSYLPTGTVETTVARTATTSSRRARVPTSI